MTTIQKSDLHQINYAEFGSMLELLSEQLQQFCIKNQLIFDLVVPILRSGAFAGMHIASKLGIT